jgi:glycine hydroxymethyltransferase
MLADKSNLESVDSEIYNAIINEEKREELNIELIASENSVSKAVLEAQGCIFTNKYAEGYPGKRYYGGNEFSDVVERLAISRAKELFGAEHVNVQSHSGSQANMSAFLSVLKPGDRILGMALSSGGHLTHGAKVNFSGQVFEAYEYGVDLETGLIDYDEVARIAEKCKPKLIVSGATAYSRIFDFKKFRKIADSVGAYLMADIAHIAGLVATGLHPSPIPYAHIVTSTTHKTLRGPRGGMIMCREEFAKAVDRAVFPYSQGGPLVHVIAAKAVAFKEALMPEFKEYQARIVKNASCMASRLVEKGFKIISGGTDNHLFLLDLTGMEETKDIDGLQAQNALEASGITLSRTTVPGEKRKPYYGSGVRIGTPAVTTRGMKEKEMELIADFIAEVLLNINDEKIFNSVRKKVENLCREFPLYN